MGANCQHAGSGSLTFLRLYSSPKWEMHFVACHSRSRASETACRATAQPPCAGPLAVIAAHDERSKTGGGGSRKRSREHKRVTCCSVHARDMINSHLMQRFRLKHACLARAMRTGVARLLCSSTGDGGWQRNGPLDAQLTCEALRAKRRPLAPQKASFSR